MRTLISILLAMVITLAILACGRPDDTVEPTPTSTPVSTPASDTCADAHSHDSAHVRAYPCALRP